MSPLAIVIAYVKQSLENWAETRPHPERWHLPRLRHAATSQRAA